NADARMAERARRGSAPGARTRRLPPALRTAWSLLAGDLQGAVPPPPSPARLASMPLFIAAASSWPTWASGAGARPGRFQARVETDSPPLMERAISVLYRTAAIVEAVTWAGLLVGMLFKYVIDGNDLGVRVFGRLHGAAFVAYVPITLLAALRFRWS